MTPIGSLGHAAQGTTARAGVIGGTPFRRLLDGE